MLWFISITIFMFMCRTHHFVDDDAKVYKFRKTNKRL